MSLNEIKIPKNMNYQKEELESKNNLGQRQLRIALKTEKATVKNQCV
jgi:hypothetical protein